MLDCFVFCHSDRELARANLQWMADLGGFKNHDILLVVPDDMDVSEELALAKKAFGTATVYPIDDNRIGWPFSPNHAWKRAVDYIDFKNIWPFLYHEADAVFLTADALDRIEEEYLDCGKEFMGHLEYPGTDAAHMNGVGVYGDIVRKAPSLLTAPTPQHASEIGVNRMAFDMAGAAEVLANMHASPLFQFQYKKEKELLKDKTLGFLRPDAVIFHTCKELEIFDLLRARSGLAKATTEGFYKSDFNGPWSIPIENLVAASLAPLRNPGNSGLTVDVFVKTYTADAMWQEQCRGSYQKYCTGFRSFVETMYGPEGYLGQQIVKLNADRYTDADYILVTDSDTLWTTPVTPETYMRDGKPMWFYDTKENVLDADKGTAKWFRTTEECIGIAPEHEFMRRQPFLVPRWLLQAFRTFIWQRHGKSVEDYVMSHPEFSEWNCLGFYAHTFHREAFAWVKNDEVPMTVRQFWSAHHFSPERRQQQFNEALPEIQQILGATEPPKLKAPRLKAPKQREELKPTNHPDNTGMTSLSGPLKGSMDILSRVMADQPPVVAKFPAASDKRQQMLDRMAKARAAKGKKK